ncbi:hypothetical protein [Clostridium tertium]|uniref:hypothetical protein n=1 Tax=Clostridium tertium TaxID=1559 RepID=UPI001AE9299C|nr:hypothetical protein [Clostridium tertium]MBP1868788.1 hypothetical protein [Clostridium tertium]
MKNKKLLWVIIFVVLVISLAIISNCYNIEGSDYFQLISSIIGTIIGAMVSFEILNITISEQRKDLDKQVKIQISNEKINDLNIMYKNIINIKDLVNKLYNSLEIYEESLYDFRDNVDYFREDIRKYRITEVNDLIGRCYNGNINIAEIGDVYLDLKLLIGNTEIIAIGLNEQKVIDGINEIEKAFSKCDQYYEKIVKNFVKYSNFFQYSEDKDYKKMTDNILDISNTTIKYKNDIYNIVPLTGGVIYEIGEYKKYLYRCKYESLDNKDN